VLCSPARRAVATLAALQRDFDRRTEVRIEERLYGADAWSLLARLHDVGPPTSSVMIVGHNPGLEDLTRMMAGDGEALALASLRAKFPTGALAVLDLGDATWSQLRAGRAYLTALVLPRELPG
jgi:phosphohistidine phosphatase